MCRVCSNGVHLRSDLSDQCCNPKGFLAQLFCCEGSRYGYLRTRNAKPEQIEPAVVCRAVTHLIADFLKAPSRIQFNSHRSEYCISPVWLIVEWRDWILATIHEQ